LLVHAILRRGVDFTFDLDPLAEVDEETHFDAGGFQVVDQLGFVGRMQIFDGFEFQDDLVFHKGNGGRCHYSTIR